MAQGAGAGEGLGTLETMKLKKILPLRGLLLGASLSVQAAPPVDSGLFDAVTVYGGQGADHNLREIPSVIARGDIDWEKSYFVGVGLGKTGPQLGPVGVNLAAGTGLSYAMGIVASTA